MTTRQIDAKYHNFIIAFIRDGEVRSTHTVQLKKFKEVKQMAVEGLTAQLSKTHGRGDHSVRVYGANLVNVTPTERMDVGFGPQWEFKEEEEVFSL